MSKISKAALEKAIKKNLMTLEPMAKNVPKKSSASSNSDGSMTVKQEKGDMYLDKQQSTAYAKSIAKAIDDHVSVYVHDTVVAKVNELIGEYNQLRLDVIAAAIPTTSSAVSKISTT